MKMISALHVDVLDFRGFNTLMWEFGALLFSIYNVYTKYSIHRTERRCVAWRDKVSESFEAQMTRT